MLSKQIFKLYTYVKLYVQGVVCKFRQQKNKERAQTKKITTYVAKFKGNNHKKKADSDPTHSYKKKES